MQRADSVDENDNPSYPNGRFGFKILANQYIFPKTYLFRPSAKENSSTSMDSCFCDSAQSIYSEKFKTSLVISQLECERCKNLLLRRGNRRNSMCPDCIAKIYSPKTCATCSGRISFQDLKDTNVLQTVNRKFVDDPSNLKLCNCYPRPFSKQLSLNQLDDDRETLDLPKIIVKSYSCDDVAAGQSSQSFFSGNSPSSQNSNDDLSSDSE